MTPAGRTTACCLLVAGLAIDAVFGDMPAVFRRVPHPVVLAGRAISFFERKLNRRDPQRARRAGPRHHHGDRLGRRRGGARLGDRNGSAAPVSLGAAVEALLIARAGRAAQPLRACRRRRRRRSTPVGSRRAASAVRHIVGRDPMSLDAHGVARAAIESLAENFSDGVVAPVFWYLLLGLPGLFAYKMANTLDSMIGHRTPRYRSFGWAAARLRRSRSTWRRRRSAGCCSSPPRSLPRAVGRAARW